MLPISSGRLQKSVSAVSQYCASDVPTWPMQRLLQNLMRQSSQFQVVATRTPQQLLECSHTHFFITSAILPKLWVIFTLIVNS
jgi:predicted transcriptional regulator